MNPTEEQEYVLSLASTTSENLQIRALAGSGKTEMLVMLQRVLPSPVLGLAFNTDIKIKMNDRFQPTGDVRTFNSLGLSIWNKATGLRCVVEKEGNRVVKTQRLFKEEVAKLGKRASREAWEIYSDVTAAVGLAKSIGYVPEGKYPHAKRIATGDELYSRLDTRPTQLLTDLVESILLASIKAAYAGSIDFDDQCYMPTLFGGPFPNFPNVLVDEQQDLSPINVEMLALLKNSRLFAVGDPWQSVYAFRGALQEGMNIQRDRFAMTTADLSVSFRCPEAIVNLAKWRAPNMKWIKPGGIVGRLKNPSSTTFPDGCAILCRNNAPLFKLALHLLSHGRSVRVGGSDIGPRLVGMMKKLGPTEMSREQTLSKIEEWRNERLAMGSTTCGDTADCMRVFANCGNTLSDAIAYASDLLRRDGTITLLTGHKSKGLEWPVVYHLDPWLIKDDNDQELNLRYVIQTRSLDSYFEVLTEEIRT